MDYDNEYNLRVEYIENDAADGKRAFFFKRIRELTDRNAWTVRSNVRRISGTLCNTTAHDGRMGLR